MSNSTANENDDDQPPPSSAKLPSFNSRITSRSMIKRQQFTETRIANNQACDEIHDLQPKYSSTKKLVENNSHQLMQGNYYDRTRLNQDPSLHEQIAISVEDYRDCIKKPTPSLVNEKSERSASPPFGETSESIQENIAHSAGKLLETKKPSTKTTTKSHNQAVLDYFPHNNNDGEQPDRSASPSSSSECSSDDSSSPNANDQAQSTVPYEPLVNDDEDEDQNLEQQVQPKPLPIDSSTKPQSQLTANSTDRVKYFPTNGYNSHGSSITTKSSSDNSGSIRTNSGSDNEEESDEEHYNNSSATTNNHQQASYSTRNPYLYTTQDLNYQTSKYSEIAAKKGEPHLQINRFKHPATDDPNKQSATDQTNPSSSSQSNSTRPVRSSKKRKQAQQQELIRTECIPGHRGDLDVDELVMFIDGLPRRPTDTNKPRLANSSASVADSNSNKTSTKKKPRKTSKSTPAAIVLDDHENESVNITTVSTALQEKQASIKQEITPAPTDSLPSNSEIVSEPFVTVTHRRRVVKERRPEPAPISRSTRFPSSPMSNDKRRPPIKQTTESTRPAAKEQALKTNSISPPAVPPSTSSSTDPPMEKQANSPRLSSHSSSSSPSSLLKRQKPPVVFLNKSVDIDLNAVSFGFDLEPNPSEEKPPTSPATEQETEMNDSLNDSKSIPEHPSQTNRTPQFYTGTSIIRPQQQRTYPATTQGSYIDPFLLYQYNQQRFAYMNLIRSPYILLPTPTTNEPGLDSQPNQPSNEQVQEPILVYTPQTGPVYLQTTTKKPYPTPELSQPAVYPPQFYYQHPAYFQPIASPSLVVENTSEAENSSQSYAQNPPPKSADIMSNALQLVYSQQRKTTQTDRFNLDDLTAYLAMKWTDTVDHYLQGDSRILYVDEQQ